MLSSRASCNLSKCLRLVKYSHSYPRCICNTNGVFSSDTNTKLALRSNVFVLYSFRLRESYCTYGTQPISYPEYEVICNETLESLTDYFDAIVEDNSHLVNTDVTYGDGVLTVNFGDPYGTYVINRQTPNKQIWLSSPTSGPKRYDFDTDKKTWIYRHDNRSLHDLLQDEIVKIVESKVDFHSHCSHSGRPS